MSLFVNSFKNISTFEFKCPDSNINFKVESDSVEITTTKQGDYTFKGVAKNNNEIVSLSPEYKISLPTGISLDSKVVQKFDLYQNYPNPLNPVTSIRYDLPINTNVVLKIYDILGNEVETLVNQEQESGEYEVIFNADRYPSGVYVYRLETSSFTDVKKMVILK